jgi:sporulation protein YlmC with PRC-barrel domain
MRTRVSVVLVILVVASSAVNCLAQSAGSSVIGVTATELREVETGWSAKKQILGRDVYSPTGDKIGSISDLIVSPNRSVSYAIVGVGGFLGMGKHDVAVPVSQLKEEVGKIVLPGATKEALKAAPEFKYAK